MGDLVPNMTVIDELHKQSGWVRTFLNRTRRDPIADHPSEFHSFVRWFLPWIGVSELEKAIANISGAMEDIENRTTDAIQALQIQVSSLSQVVSQNQIALDLLLASHPCGCTIIHTGGCMYVDKSSRISTT